MALADDILLIEQQITGNRDLPVEVQTPSKWGRLRQVVTAIASYQHAALLNIDRARADIEAALRAKSVPTDAWLRSRCLLFQYSEATPYILTVDPVTYERRYTVEAPDDRIITQASVRTVGERTVQIKVAKGTTTLAPLTSTELAAFEAYLERIGPPGTLYDVISIAANQLTITGQITYLGTSPEAAVRPLVEKAITDYLAAFSATDFDGTFRRIRLIDAIQALGPVIVDVGLSTIIMDGSTAIGDSSTLPAGHAVVTPGTLSSTLTFIPGS